MVFPPIGMHQLKDKFHALMKETLTKDPWHGFLFCLRSSEDCVGEPRDWDSCAKKPGLGTSLLSYVLMNVT